MIPRPYTRDGSVLCDAWLTAEGAFERAVRCVVETRLGLPLAVKVAFVELCFVIEGPTCFMPPRGVRYVASVRRDEEGGLFIPDAASQRAEAIELLRRARLAAFN